MFAAFFKNASLRRKLIVLYVLFVGVPMVLLLSVVVPISHNIIVRHEYENREQLLSLMAESVEFKMESVEKYILSIYNVGEIFHNPDANSIVVRNALYNYFSGSSYFIQFMYIDKQGDSYLYVSQNYPYAPSSIMKRLSPEIIPRLDDANGRIVWISPAQLINDNEGDFFVCGNLVKNIHEGHVKTGYALYLLDIKMLAGIFDSLRFGENDIVSIYDINMSQVWSNNEKNLIPTVFANERYTITRIDGVRYLNVYNYSRYNDWLFVSSTPVNELNYLSNLFVFFLSASLVFLLICLVVETYVISRVFIKPIHKLVVGIDMIEQGAEWKLQPPSRHDEIAALYNSVKDMSLRIQNLLNDIENAHRNELEQEISALQAQIKPHFIYNTLDSIAWMAREEKFPQISKVIIRLSNIIRYSITKSKCYATIRQELQWADEYIKLQLMRTPKLFVYEKKISDEVLNFYTFRLVLQPFLENSIIHGFSKMSCGGIIRVEAYMMDGDVHIIVSDNGKGISDDVMISFNFNMERGIGIYNVHRRIRMFFGPRYGVKVASVKGTQIHITLPAITQSLIFE